MEVATSELAECESIPIRRARKVFHVSESAMMYLQTIEPKIYEHCRPILIQSFFRATWFYHTKHIQAQIVLSMLFLFLILLECYLLNDYFKVVYHEAQGTKVIFVLVTVTLIQVLTNSLFPVITYCPMQPTYVEALYNTNRHSTSMLISGYPSSFLLYRSQSLILVAICIAISQLVVSYNSLLSSMFVCLASATSGLWISGMILLLSDIYASRRTQWMFPEYVLINLHMSQLLLLRRYHSFRREFEFRLRLMLLIKQSAMILEGPLAYRLSDTAGDTASLISHFAKIAADVRTKATWLATPQEETFYHFQHHLVNSLPNIVDGQWHFLSHSEIAGADSTITMRFIAVAHGLFVAFAPITALLIIQETNLALDPAQQNIATIVAVLWAVVSTLASLDPNYRDKISAVSSVAGVIDPFAK